MYPGAHLMEISETTREALRQKAWAARDGIEAAWAIRSGIGAASEEAQQSGDHQTAANANVVFEAMYAVEKLYALATEVLMRMGQEYQGRVHTGYVSEKAKSARISIDSIMDNIEIIRENAQALGAKQDSGESSSE
jgi:hypothetical protein